MRNDDIRHSRDRFVALMAGAASGAAAVAVSQWHVLPPMQCFALLTAGLAVLGATAFLAAKWHLPAGPGKRAVAVVVPAARDVAVVRLQPRSTHVHS